MKIILSITLTFAFSIICFGQLKETCSLSNKESPALRNLKLGMTEQQGSVALGMKITTEKSKSTVLLVQENGQWVEPKPTNQQDIIDAQVVDIGEKQFFYVKPPVNINPNLENIKLLVIRFYKNLIYEMSLQYDNTIYKWKDAAEFSSILSEKLKLPKNAWNISNPNSAMLKCQDFGISIQVKADIVLINLFNSVRRDEITAQAKKAFFEQEKQKELSDKKKSFKP